MQNTLIGGLILGIVSAPFAPLIWRGWSRRKVEGWHIRARWVRRLQGDAD
jgi:hypothetical protein